MTQGVGLCDGLKLFAGLAEEGSARAGQNQTLDLGAVAAAHQALEDGGVFRVHGDDLGPVGPGGLHHKLARADHGLLVGKSNALAALQGGKRGAQSHHADHGGDHRVGLLQGCGGEQAFLPPQDLRAGLREQTAQRLCGFLGCHADQAGAELRDLLSHSFDAAARGQSRDADRQMAHNVECLTPDGAGRA